MKKKSRMTFGGNSFVCKTDLKNNLAEILQIERPTERKIFC